MAVSTHIYNVAGASVNFGPKTRTAIFYMIIGFVAIAISVPAAIATADIGIFEECFAAADVCAGG